MRCDGRHSERSQSDSLTHNLDSLDSLAAARSCDSETEMPLDLCSAQVSRTLPILCVSVDRRRSVDPGADAQALEATPSPVRQSPDSFNYYQTVGETVGRLSVRRTLEWAHTIFF